MIKPWAIATLSLCGMFFTTPALVAGYPDSEIQSQLQQARQTLPITPSSIAPGELRIVEYIGRPVFIYHRTIEDLEYLARGESDHLQNPLSADLTAVLEDQYRLSTDQVWVRLLMVTQPQLEKQPYRSLTDDYLVVMGHSPLGCALRMAPPELRPMPSAPFLDVCSGAWFDVAGRRLKSDWKPPRSRSEALVGANLLIPPHQVLPTGQLLIGLAPTQTIPAVDFTAVRSRIYARLGQQDRLLFAAAYNDEKEVRLALQSGALANTGNVNKNPLDAAIAGGSIVIVKLLLEHGARPSANSHELIKLLQRTELEELFADENQVHKPSIYIIR